MIVDIECPRCNGNGEVLGGTRNMRSRMVGHDDLDPNDFTTPCDDCLGTGVVEYDPEDDADE